MWEQLGDDRNYNWRLHRRVCLRRALGLNWELRREWRWEVGPGLDCLVSAGGPYNTERGEQSGEISREHGVRRINIYPQCSHYDHNTRWTVLVRIHLRHSYENSGLNITLCIYLSVWTYSSYHPAPWPSLAGKKRIKGELSVSDGDGWCGADGQFLPPVPHHRHRSPGPGVEEEEERKLIFEILFQFITSRLHTNLICRLLFSPRV